MAKKFQNLTVDYRKLLRLGMQDRLDLLRSGYGESIFSRLTAEEFSRLFPKYYSDKLPDVGVALKSIMSRDFKTTGGVEQPPPAATGTPTPSTGRTRMNQPRPGGTTTEPAKINPILKKLEQYVPGISDPRAKAQISAEKEELFNLFRSQKQIASDHPRAKLLEGLSEQDLQRLNIKRTESGYEMLPTKTSQMSDQELAATNKSVVGMDQLSKIIPSIRNNPALAEAINKQAKELGVTPASIAMVLKVENPNLNASISGGAGKRYSGLYQMGPAELRSVGHTPESFKSLSAVEQTEVWGQWLKKVNFTGRANITEGDTNQNFTMLMANQLGSGRNLKDKDGNFVLARNQSSNIGGTVTFNTLAAFARGANPLNEKGTDEKPLTREQREEQEYEQIKERYSGLGLERIPKGVDPAFSGEWDKMSARQRQLFVDAIPKVGGIEKMNELIKGGNTGQQIIQNSQTGETGELTKYYKEMQKKYGEKIDLNSPIWNELDPSLASIKERLVASKKVDGMGGYVNRDTLISADAIARKAKEYGYSLRIPPGGGGDDKHSSNHGRGRDTNFSIDVQFFDSEGKAVHMGKLSPEIREQMVLAAKGTGANRIGIPVRGSSTGMHVQSDKYKPTAVWGYDPSIGAGSRRTLESTEEGRRFLRVFDQNPNNVGAINADMLTRIGLDKPQKEAAQEAVRSAEEGKKSEVLPTPQPNIAPAPERQPITPSLPEKPAATAEPAKETDKEKLDRLGVGTIGSYALGGETEASGPLTAYAIDKDKLRRDDTLVTDGRVKFTMNSEKESMKYNPDTGKVQIDQAKGEVRQKISPETIVPKAAETDVTSPQSEREPQQQQSQQQVVVQQPYQPSNQYEETNALTDNIFKSPSFHRAIARTRFQNTGDAALGGHFDWGATNIT